MSEFSPPALDLPSLPTPFDAVVDHPQNDSECPFSEGAAVDRLVKFEVCRHLGALRNFQRQRPADDAWRTRPKRKFVDLPDDKRPKFRLRSWEDLHHG